MRTTKDIGDFYEKITRDHYTKNGHTILAQNYRFGKSEIDFISLKENTTCFVEVKFRKSKSYGNSEEMVSDTQMERILEAAEDFIFKNNITTNIRFDIVAINKNHEIEVFEDAFG